MTPKFKTRDVSKSAYTNYLKRAEECFNAAQHSLQEQEWNASAINAIHCCIAACDAMCVYFLGKRYSGESHNDASKLFKTIKSTDEYNINANRILRILRMKNMRVEEIHNVLCEIKDKGFDGRVKNFYSKDADRASGGHSFPATGH